VIQGFSDKIRAVLALCAGMALFFTACAPVPSRKEAAAPEEKPAEAVEAKAPRPDYEKAREAADGYWRQGRAPQALEAYRAYLRQVPPVSRDPLVLDRVGRLLQDAGRYREARAAFRRLCMEHPGYAGLPEAELRAAECLVSMGEYAQARKEVLDWIEAHPGHSLTAVACLLLGRTEIALGRKVEAFRWWLGAWKALEKAEKRDALRSRLRERIERLIQASDLEQLEAMKIRAAGSDFAQQLLYRLALLYLEQSDLDRAMKAAMALVRTTTEQHWVTRGRRIMERIFEEREVRRNVLGCLLPLSGPFAIYGEQVLNGIQLGLMQSAADGVELAIRDTEGSPEQAVRGLEDLVSHEKVLAVIGPLVSKAAVAAAERSVPLGIPLITLTQKEGVTRLGETVFRNFLTPSAEVEKLLDTVLAGMGLKRYAVLYPDNAYGRYLMNLFWDRLETMGGTVTAAESYGPDQTDFAQQIKKMIGIYYPRPAWEEERIRQMKLPEEEECEIYPEDEPLPVVDFDAVFIPDVAQRVVMIAPQLAFHDVLYVQLMGTSLWQAPELIEEARDYVRNALFPSGFFADARDPDIAAFVHVYQDNYDEPPGLLAATGYDTIRLLLEVMSERQGGFRTRKEFREALRDWPPFHGVTGDFRFGPDGDVIKEPFILTVRKGRILPYPW